LSGPQAGEAFKLQRKLLVGSDGIALEAFLSRPVMHWTKRWANWIGGYPVRSGFV